MMCSDGEWCLLTGNSVYYCWLISSDDVVWWIIIVNDVSLEMETYDRGSWLLQKHLCIIILEHVGGIYMRSQPMVSINYCLDSKTRQPLRFMRCYKIKFIVKFLTSFCLALLSLHLFFHFEWPQGRFPKKKKIIPS